ncbi:MAG: prepilin peptidase [Parvibaculaceae bacterium]
MNMLLLAVFPLAMIFGAVWDLATMTIPNVLTIALAAMFFVLVPFAGLGWEAVALHVGAGLLMLLVGMALFGFGWIGGGDAKFVAAIALWLGWYDLPAYLIVASVLGGALTLLLLWFRTLPLPLFMMKREWIARLHEKKGGIPYGVALGAAGLFMFQHSVWFEAAAQAA